MSIVETERVLVVPTSVFHELGHFQGFTTDVDAYLDGLLRCEQISYRPRAEMEEDPSFKQLIPYMIFRHTDADGGQHIFQYTRGSGQGESRLHAKVSVGVGGHISTLDIRDDGVDPYTAGMQRELDEEVIVESPYTQSLAGLINDDETDVGKVHLGVVHLFDVEEPLIKSREDEIMDAGFRTLEETMSRLDQMETWSSICMKALFG